MLGNIVCYHLLHGKTRGISICIKFGGSSSSITMSNKKVAWKHCKYDCNSAFTERFGIKVNFSL